MIGIIYRPTWEPARRISAQVPLIVEAFEKQKQKDPANGKSNETSAGSSEATAGRSVQNSAQARNPVILAAYNYV